MIANRSAQWLTVVLVTAAQCLVNAERSACAEDSLETVLRSSGHRVTAFETLPDSSLLLVGCLDGEIRLIDLETDLVLDRVESGGIVTSLVTNEDADSFAAVAAKANQVTLVTGKINAARNLTLGRHVVLSEEEILGTNLIASPNKQSVCSVVDAVSRDPPRKPQNTRSVAVWDFDGNPIWQRKDAYPLVPGSWVMTRRNSDRGRVVAYLDEMNLAFATGTKTKKTMIERVDLTNGVQVTDEVNGWIQSLQNADVGALAFSAADPVRGGMITRVGIFDPSKHPSTDDWYKFAAPFAWNGAPVGGMGSYTEFIASRNAVLTDMSDVRRQQRRFTIMRPNSADPLVSIPRGGLSDACCSVSEHGNYLVVIWWQRTGLISGDRRTPSLRTSGSAVVVATDGEEIARVPIQFTPSYDSMPSLVVREEESKLRCILGGLNANVRPKPELRPESTLTQLIFSLPDTEPGTDYRSLSPYR